MAQVKLAFKNTNGVDMIATRSMQVTIKRTTRTFKTLEGQLLAIKDGTRRTISTRCAELDAQLPIYLGVSKAVLENVIFCHQEDSLWPLSEPSVLKKKFDEIFESQKFAKALDNIKSLRKGYAVDVKLEEQHSNFLKANKEKAHKIGEQLKSLNKQIEEYATEADKYERDIEYITDELDSLQTTKQKFMDVLEELDHLLHEIKVNNENISRLESNSEILSDSEESLQNSLDNFSNQANQWKKDLIDIDTKIKKEKSAQSDTIAHHEESRSKEGQLKAEYENHLNDIKRRYQQAKALTAELKGLSQNIKDKFAKHSQSDLTEDDYSDLMHSLDELASRYRLELEGEKAKNAVEENKYTSKIQETTTEKLRHEQAVISLTKSVRDCTEKIASLNTTIDSISVTDGDLAYKESQLQEMSGFLENVTKTLETIKSEGKITKLEALLKAIGQEMDDLNQELSIINQESDNRAKLAYLQEELAKKKNAHKSLISAKKEEFKRIDIDLTDDENSSVDAEKNLRDTIQRAQKVYDDSVHEDDSINREHSLIQSKLNMKNAQIEKLEKEKKDLFDYINSVIEIDYKDYDSQLEEYSAKQKTLSSSISNISIFKDLNSQAVDFAKNQNKCVMCYREFHNHEKDTFLQLIQEKDNRLTNVEQMQKELDEVTEIVEALTSIRQSVDRLNTIESVTLPYDLEEKKKLEKELDVAASKLESSKEAKEKAKMELERVEQLRRAASDLTRSQNDINNIKSQMSSLQLQLKNDSDNFRSSSDLLLELSKKNEQSKKYRKKLDQLIEARDNARSSMAKYEKSISEQRSAVEKIKSQLKTQKDAEEEKRCLEKKRIELNDTIVAEKEKMKSIQTLILEQEGERNELRRKGAERERDLALKYSDLLDSVKDIKRISESISEYEKQGGKENLIQCQSVVKTLADQLKASSSKIEQLNKKLNDTEKALVDLRNRERVLKDNLEVKRLKRENSNKSARVKELNKQNAELERDKFRQRVGILQKEKDRLSTLHAGKMGELIRMRNQAQELKNELETEYKNVEKEYLESLIKFRTTNVANEDLAKYSKALDNAIMKYHSLKMEEINRIIDELWKHTYSGTDVDTILIRSDNETTRGNRAYNYRVCMVKKDVELDMRGRCSAGQKVLASIIIRLALAECFGTSCGIIALDEPTTNLDSDNIESLAQALNNLIATRRVQKNFQLIVITHDEKFLTHMNAASYTDHFFRVSRNERQTSQIEWVPISKIME